MIERLTNLIVTEQEVAIKISNSKIQAIDDNWIKLEIKIIYNYDIIIKYENIYAIT